MQIKERANTVLYQYTVEEEVETFVEVSEVDEETGEEITRKKKTVTKKPTEVRFRRPTSRESSAADFRHTVAWNEAVSAGILPQKAIFNIYSNMGGPLDKKNFEEFNKAIGKRLDAINQIQFLMQKEVRTEEENAELEKQTAIFRESSTFISEIENQLRNLFDKSADSIADEARFKFLMFNCTEIKEEGDGEFKKLFPAQKGVDIQAGFSAQKELYEKAAESEDPNLLSIIDKMLRVYALYIYNPNITPEEVKEQMALWYKEEGKEAEVVEAVKDKEEPVNKEPLVPERKRPVKKRKPKVEAPDVEN